MIPSKELLEQAAEGATEAPTPEAPIKLRIAKDEKERIDKLEKGSVKQPNTSDATEELYKSSGQTVTVKKPCSTKRTATADEAHHWIADLLK